MIILLNGTSSSGKSCIVKELQEIHNKPLLVVGIDMIINMMPRKYIVDGRKAEEGFEFIKSTDDEGRPLIHVALGKHAHTATSCLPKIVKTMTGQGFDIAIDETLFLDDILRYYVQELPTKEVYFIKVECSLKEITKREKSRGDRFLGIARDQFDRVHGPTRCYDFAVDTTNISAKECAKQIMAFIQKTPEPTGFKQMKELFKKTCRNLD